MIQKLQRRFIKIAGFSAVSLMIVLMVPLNIFIYFWTGSELKKTLSYIIEVGGVLPDFADVQQKDQESETFRAYMQKNPPQSAAAEGDAAGTEAEGEDLRLGQGLHFNAESIYQLRFFLVKLSREGEAENFTLNHIAAVDREKAESMASRYRNRLFDSGYLKEDGIDYYYLVRNIGNGESVIGFLDCSREMQTFRLEYGSSIGFGLLMVLTLLIIIYVLSKKAMQPYIDNMESQKQFITNAGHELKTPLAIISANTEVIEMLNGKSEWTDSIMAQVHRSTGLINELITLSRMSEAHEAVFEDVDLTEEVTEAAESFRTLILQQGKKLETEIMPKVTVRAERAFSAELINILLDNAAKYCDDGGTVRVELKKKGRAGALLRVQNDYRDGADVDYSRLFQRFYREDSSHNSKKSGYGIGLAMAQTIMERVKGSINAYWKDGVVTFTVIYQ